MTQPIVPTTVQVTGATLSGVCPHDGYGGPHPVLLDGPADQGNAFEPVVCPQCGYEFRLPAPK